MLKILQVFHRILDVALADGEKRVKFAIENVIYMAFAVICAWGAVQLIQYVGVLSSSGCDCANAGYGALAIFGIIVCVAMAVYTLIAGVISQAVLLVVSFIGSLVSASKARNLLAFIISFASIAVATVAGLFLFGVLPV